MTNDKAKFTQASICHSLALVCVVNYLVVLTKENVSAKDKNKYLLEKI